MDAYVELLKKHVERFSNVFRRFVDTIESPSSEDPETGGECDDERRREEINALIVDFRDVKNPYEVTRKKLYS